MAKKKPYDVGYCKPPKKSRFKIGQSGNPQGRPLKSKNANRIISEELDNRLVVMEQGQQRTITLREATLKKLVGKAIGGDLKAMIQVLAMDGAYQETLKAQQTERKLSTTDTELLLSYCKTMLLSHGITSLKDLNEEEA